MEFIDEKKGIDPRPFDPLFFKTTGITDRDAPSLYAPVGARDLYQLWADKIDLEDSSQEDDTLFTDNARKLFQEKLDDLEGVGELRYCYVQSQAVPFLRAILDGASFSGEKVLARIVTQDKEAFNRVTALHLPTRSGRVPEHHWVELQHQMIVSGVDTAYFVSTIDGTQIKATLVKADLVFCSNHVAECILFWDYVRRGTPPPNALVPPDSDPDASDEELPLGTPELPLPKRASP